MIDNVPFYPFPWELIEQSSVLINLALRGFLLAIYYAAFLTPKSTRIKPIYVFIIFGGAYFALRVFAGQAFSLLGIDPSFLTLNITSALIILLLSYVLFNKNIYLNIFLLLSFFAIRELSFFITQSTIALIRSIQPIDQLSLVLVSELIMLYAGVLFSALIQFITCHSIIKAFIYKPKIVSLSEFIYLLIPCLLGLFVTFVLRSIFIIPADDGRFMSILREVPFAAIWAILANVVLLVSFKATIALLQSLIKLNAEEKERSVLQKQIQQMQEHLRDTDSIYAEIRGMRHDMKSHLSNIRLLMKSHASGDSDAELEDYLSKFEGELNKFEFVYQTGNSVSDIIIHQKRHEAIGNGIDFTANFIYPSRLNIDAYDLAIILNNGLENAIEACSNQDISNPYIRLYAFTKGELFFIEIENSFAGDVVLNKHTGLPLSRKDDDGLHSIGLANIRRCAKKYLGDIELQTTQSENGKVFRLTVMLQGQV